MVLDVSVSDSLSPWPPWVDGADGVKEHGLSDSVPTPALCSLRVCFIDGKSEVQRGSAARARWRGRARWGWDSSSDTRAPCFLPPLPQC